MDPSSSSSSDFEFQDVINPWDESIDDLDNITKIKTSNNREIQVYFLFPFIFSERERICHNHPLFGEGDTGVQGGHSRQICSQYISFEVNFWHLTQIF